MKETKRLDHFQSVFVVALFPGRTAGIQIIKKLLSLCAGGFFLCVHTTQLTSATIGRSGMRDLKY